MSFIDGYLALCSAVSVGACTEFGMAGYARQPISFAKPTNGFSRNSTSWSFGAGFGAPMAGRAIFDNPVVGQGNLLLVLPHFAPRQMPGNGPLETGDVGDITLVLTALAPYFSGDAFTGLLPASSVIGSCYDVGEIIGTANSSIGAPTGASVFQLSSNQFRFAYASPLSTGPGQLAINRGVLQLQARSQGIE